MESRQAAESYRVLFQAHPQPMWVYDVETLRFLAVNDAALDQYGYTLEEFLAISVEDLSAPANLDGPAVWGAAGERSSTVAHRTKTGCVLRAAITSKSVAFAGRPAVLAVAERTGVAVVADIGRQNSPDQQLRQSQKLEALGRLAGGVAHDFNNLMTVVSGFGRMVFDSLAADDPAREAAGEIVRAGDRAAALAQQLLAFSRRQATDLSILNLNQVIREMERMLRRVIGEDVELLTWFDPGLGNIRADRGQIEQVIMNLAVNARDAMPRGGRLLLETLNVDLEREQAARHPGLKPGSYVFLRVRDNGKGMDENTRRRVFEPFFTTKEAGRGTGLGLSTVYAIVREGGGDVSFTSMLDVGTSFYIYLPRADGSIEEPEDESPGCLQGSETILLVEDEPGVRRLTRDLLRKRGYTVLDAGDGREALELYRGLEARIDLLIADVVMPQMSGRDLFECLRRMQPDLEVIFLSGHAEPVIAEHGALEPGAVLLHKPFTATALGRAIREVLG